MSPEQRFYTKVDASGGPSACHPWTKAVDRDGYGQFWFQNRHMKAHRVAWFLEKGEHVPSDMVIDHLCRRRDCMNVSHMEIVTNVENVMRGNSPAALAALKEVCKNGHPFDGVRKNPNHRKCTTCLRESSKQYQRRKRAAEKGQ